jgi:SAM-dependent methyltransferase
VSTTATTERTRQYYQRDASKYDGRIRFFERLLFGGGREWVYGQAEGEVLEIALGTGRNLPFYPDGVRLTGVELSPAMLEIAARRAVAEAKRVLRPGGRFFLLEHVRSPVLPIRAGQRVLEPLFARFQCDHLLREPLEHLEAEGFEIERVERSKLGIVERIAARKPAGRVPDPARRTAV